MGGQGSGRLAREDQDTGRKKRIPLGRPRFKLSASQLIPPGKVGRWVNDDPGRLEAAEEGGYTFLNDAKAVVGESGENERDMLSTKVCRRVGTREGGHAKTAYLMVIDKDTYDNDQAEKEGEIKRMEDGLRRGEITQPGGLKAGDGMYTPEEGIKIDHTKVTRRSS
jgi:hypothetical protein